MMQKLGENDFCFDCNQKQKIKTNEHVNRSVNFCRNNEHNPLPRSLLPHPSFFVFDHWWQNDDY
jgi:hypothetical protein